MRIAYLDCFAGISGDMFLGALLDAGVEASVLQRSASALGLGAELRVHTVDRSGITATKVDVMEGGALAEAAAKATLPLAQSSPLEQEDRSHTHQPRTQHLHKGGHSHQHEHSHKHGHSHAQGEGEDHAPHAHGEHQHGRSLSTIRTLIQGAELADEVKQFALRAFTLLGESEAKIHSVPVEQIHFHEVGAVDAMVDIVAAAAGVVHLGKKAMAETGQELAWHSSPLNVGGGMVQCAHGNFPVPAPATADLLRGVPTYGAHVQKELVTPTGAALVQALAPSFGPQPAMQVSAIGYGAGTRNPEGFPNVLRLLIGESAGVDGLAKATATGEVSPRARGAETVVVLETAIDDMNPQVVAYVLDRLLERGALDVMTSAVGMKKGRQGVLLTVLAREEGADALEDVLLRETSTLGVRRRTETRSRLERSHVTVATSFGPIRVKVGALNGEVLNARPEYEDCRAAAGKHGVPLKRVIEAAIAAHVRP